MKKKIWMCGTVVTFLLFIVIVSASRKSDVPTEARFLMGPKSKGIQAAFEIAGNIAEQIIPKVSEMPKIVDIIIGEDYHTALCEDGTVWRWCNGQTTQNALKIPKLEGIVKIMEADATSSWGSTLYALSEDGYIYAWGSNRERLVSYEETEIEEFPTPVRMDGLSGIVNMDARNGKGFAVDKNGTFYEWGLPMYWYDDDYKPGFPENKKELVRDVEALFAGAGDYSYFIKKDGTVFAIMSASIFDYPNYVYPYIFPALEDGEINPNDEDFTWQFVTQLDENSKFGKTVLYELGKSRGIGLIASDAYTMFLYDEKDNSLWYWNSSRIRYHDDYNVMVDAGTCREDYRGKFEEIVFTDYIWKGDGTETKIKDICAGKENVLFLTDDGQVFLSEYVTYDVQDIAYYWYGSGGKQGDDFYGNMKLKELNFRRCAGVEGIVSINTDGKYCFSAVNEQGEYFKLDLTPVNKRYFQKE